MGQVDRHLQTVEAGFYEHLEHGRLGSVTSGGTYIHFTSAFGAAPHVVGFGVNEAIGTTLTMGAEPAAGSCKVKTTAPGTVKMCYTAWGAR